MADDPLRTIGVIAKILDSIANIEFKQYQLTRGQYMYLTRICEHPGLTQTELIDLLKVDRATATRAVQRLEEHGFVRREVDQQDRKLKHIWPTDHAQTVYPRIKAENDFSTQVALAGFSDAEAQQLSELLARMQQNLDGSWDFVKQGGQREY
ncbi:MarR family winged helix-turn-helix transcriptional regulator [Secundilactobacillus similis]|uniref:MarR family transcriptional regulator n=1 Tax=Secundilactobacillus similis DSM 23365 = JCM 2765 TaxID=1423804 RepID=A0A0R2ETJ5_9LACO|nr:MarR family transcriptional regulator [Secundilactobacillus similis]KRN15980.1 MarR family transcriptional regulator [Secundilactobacillus similis DSM 23365 = JCM 2765]